MSHPEIVVSLRELGVDYPTRSGLWRKRVVHAVRDVSFDIRRGETYGLVGESGSGKSTVGRAIAGLVSERSGEIRLGGEPLAVSAQQRTKGQRRAIQVVFQNPFASLNPTMTGGATIGEMLKLHFSLRGDRQTTRCLELLDAVQLPKRVLNAYPGSLSGGQRQRLAIARAIAAQPSLIVLDEPLSALDLSTRNNILHTLVEIQDEMGFAYLFIGHDISLIRHLSDRVGVLYLGALAEEGSASLILDAPKHPYTRGLAVSVPSADTAVQARRRELRRELVRGEPPSPFDLPAGCALCGRCPHEFARCRIEAPKLLQQADGRRVACHLADGSGVVSGEADESKTRTTGSSAQSSSDDGAPVVVTDLPMTGLLTTQEGGRI